MAIAAVVVRDDEDPTVDSTVSAACEGLHAGHSVMGWDPTMADEMVEHGCGWPYEPFLSTIEGGKEDRQLAAPFEPRRYAELWAVLTTAGAGVCSVAALPDPPSQGFVFGFIYRVAAPGCPGAEPSVELVAREYAARAQRDTAVSDDPSDRTFVLGRWALSVSGDTELAELIVDGLLGLGAVAKPS